MADFAPFTDQRGVEQWINLDYVLRVEQEPGPNGAATLHLSNGSMLTMNATDAARLVKRLKRAAKKKKKKKKKRISTPSEAPGAGTGASGPA